MLKFSPIYNYLDAEFSQKEIRGDHALGGFYFSSVVGHMRLEITVKKAKVTTLADNSQIKRAEFVGSGFDVDENLNEDIGQSFDVVNGTIDENGDWRFIKQLG